ncbi:MAG TPA: GGDEF domain-containing protein [Candidatus Tenderia sp.]|nr:GGDEF domain-containing protein [Candidatus Tenderia sp.]
MANSAPPDRWKHKYLDALDELEAREKEWADTEQVLRRGLSRMALISQGADPLLDKRLKALRNTLRKSDNISQINQLVEAVAERVKLLDEAGEAHGVPRPQEILAGMLDAITFPGPLQRQAKKLKKRLAATHAEDHLSELTTELAALVCQSLQAGQSGASAEGRAGLLSRLFGKDKGAAQSPVPPSEKITESSDDAGHREHRPSSVDELHLLEGVFVDVLEFLTFPSEFSERVQTLKSHLEEGIEIDQVKPFTMELVTLVVDMRKGLEAEKEELEEFLQQLTRRLFDLDAMIEGAETQRRASLESGRQLNEMVNAQVTDIENVVQSASELEQIKVEIQGSLDSIRNHLSEQRSLEDSHQAELEQQLQRMTRRIKAMEEESEHLKKRLEIERTNALTDPLTGAPNRLAYDQRIAQEFARWQRHQNPLSLVLMDIDHFKQINDTFGHKAGDRALKAIVQALRQHVRASDFMARIGGEEFVLLLPETDLEGASLVAEKLRRGIESCEFAYKGKPVPITISGGIAQFAAGDTAEAVYVRADEGLYRAKRQGRNQFQGESQ